MNRFSSMAHIPMETRRALRSRFTRFLPVMPHSVSGPGERPILDDEHLLTLLLDVRIEPSDDLTQVRALFQASPSGSEPTLQQRMDDGWLRVVWGRVFIARDLSRAARNLAKAEGETSFAAFVRTRFDVAYRFSADVLSHSDIGPLAMAVASGTQPLHAITSLNPAWVAARLWDRTYLHFPNPSAALRAWLDRWKVLDSPALTPRVAWDGPAHGAFVDAATHVLDTEASLADWDSFRHLIGQQRALATGVPAAELANFLPAVPATLVDRALWLDDHLVQRAMFDAMGELDDVAGIVRLLLYDAEAAQDAVPPHSLIKALIDRSASRPELLFLMLLSLSRHPALLADAVLYPPSSALACLLIAQWRSPAAAWDRDIHEREDTYTKAAAFADAFSVLVEFLDQGSVAPQEAAALFSYLHEQANALEDNSAARLLNIACAELAALPVPTLVHILAPLTARALKQGFGSSSFNAALDIVRLVPPSEAVDSAALVTAYATAIRAPKFGLARSAPDTRLSVTLCELAKDAPTDLQQSFFYPLDIAGRIAAASDAKENPYTVEDELVRSLRVHMLVLGRAVAGWEGAPPPTLSDALMTAVRAGARADPRAGRVPAFAPRYESQLYGSHQGPHLAVVLSAALARLQGVQQAALFDAILETDEPTLLAQLLPLVSIKWKSRIESRIEQLVPRNAGEIRSLPEAQARVDALLNAGLANAASGYIAEEARLQPMGRPPGREMARFRATLRLHLLRNDRAAIANADIPSELTPVEQAEAREAIRFYLALAALADPGGDREAAEAVLLQLHQNRPDIAAYAVDVFAVRIMLLIGADVFRQLGREELDRAREILGEAEASMLRVRSPSAFDKEIFACNKAILLLTMGQADAAISELNSAPIERLADRKAAYSAVALVRLERPGEAAAILDKASREFGETDALRAARGHVEAGRPAALRADVADTDDPVQRIRFSFSQLVRMNALAQAEVVHSPREAGASFKYIIGQVRQAFASVSALVPFVRFEEHELHEDDITALTRELLAARLNFLGWSVADQSKAGFSKNANPGEPDLMILQDRETLAVVEAVVCKDSVAEGNLVSHFQKLLGYGTCSLFFHVTYAYLNDVAPILGRLRTIASTQAPPGFVFRLIEELPAAGALPGGFLARYGKGDDEVQVVFLTIDLRQQRQRDAAATAGLKQNFAASKPAVSAPNLRGRRQPPA